MVADGQDHDRCAPLLRVRERRVLPAPVLVELDHRHFATMRPRHLQALQLLPA